MILILTFFFITLFFFIEMKLFSLGLVLSFSVFCACWDVRSHMASSTPYDFRTSPLPDYPYQPPEGCTLVSVELLARHGSRYPTTDVWLQITSLESLLNKYKDQLRVPWMKTWKNKIPLKSTGLLSELGISEHQRLGQNFSTMFKSALSPYNPNVIRFRSTHVSRTSQSGFAFGNGMNGFVDPDVIPEPVIPISKSAQDDIEMAYFNNCPRYEREVTNNETSKQEQKLWGKEQFPAVAARVEAITGIPKEELIKDDNIYSMWRACNFDVLVFEKVDGWCSLFVEQDAVIFEYYYDLKKYYVSGPGIELSWKVSGALLYDIVTSLEKSAGEPQPDDYVPTATLRFAHGETVVPLVTLLGLYSGDGKPLTHDWTMNEITNRIWKASAITPMATNLAFAQYRCPNMGDGTYIELFQNEKSTPVPGCNSNRLCEYSTFKELYKDYILTPDEFSNYCQ